MEQSLDGRVAVVTGASHGLGKAIAKHLASLGTQIALIARHTDPLQQVADDIISEGGCALAVSCDVSNKMQVQESAKTITSEFSGVDILINNAGIPAPRTFHETDFSDWDTVIGVNLTGVFYMTRALWLALTASGHGYVINISGTAGVRGSGSPAYGSAKFGLTGLNHAIAVAGKDYNLRSTILYPGSIDTGWRDAPIGEKPRAETMDPNDIAYYIGQLLTSPVEFVVNEAVLNPIAHSFN